MTGLERQIRRALAEDRERRDVLPRTDVQLARDLACSERSVARIRHAVDFERGLGLGLVHADEARRRMTILLAVDGVELQLVAAVAGVTVATLRRALLGRAVRSYTRRRIEEALADCGWMIELLPSPQSRSGYANRRSRRLLGAELVDGEPRRFVLENQNELRRQD